MRGFEISDSWRADKRRWELHRKEWISLQQEGALKFHDILINRYWLLRQMVSQRDFFGPVTNSSVGRSLATPPIGADDILGRYSTAEFILGVDVECFTLLVKRDLSLLPLF